LEELDLRKDRRARRLAQAGENQWTDNDLSRSMAASALDAATIGRSNIRTGASVPEIGELGYCDSRPDPIVHALSTSSISASGTEKSSDSYR
jgi:hypothetical protein